MISARTPYSNKNAIDYTILEIVFAPHLSKLCWLVSDQSKKPFNPKTNTKEWGQHELLCNFREIQEFLNQHEDHLPCIIPHAAELMVIDLDKIKEPHEEWPKWVITLVEKIGSYCEISQSGTGLHIVVEGKSPGSHVVGNFEGCKVEFLTNHPLTLTGSIFQHFDTIQPISNNVLIFYHTVFPHKADANTIQEPKSPAMTDEAIIALCRRSANQKKFQSLFDVGDLRGYHEDDSSADLGLCSLLAFYTQDAEQIDRLFQLSALHRRPERITKWARSDYKTTTIKKAIEGCGAYYQHKKPNLHETIDSWSNPLSIEQGEETEIGFPLEVLPECLRVAAEEVGRFAHADPALAIVPGLGMAALQTGKKILIQEKPGLEHHPSLIIVGAVDTGERKSGIEDAMLHDIKDAIDNENPEYQKQMAAVKAHNDLVTDQISLIKKKLREEKIEKHAALAEIEMLYGSIKPSPAEPINFSEDITPQRLFQKLHQHGGAYGILSADARKLFNRVLGRAEHNGVTGEDIYISASWGDTIHRSRVTGKDMEGEDLFVRKPALSIAALVQKDLWREFLRNKTMRESGFIARFCPVSPLSRMGTRFETEHDEPLNKAKIQPFTDAILKLRRWKVKQPVLLPLSPMAAQKRRDFYNSIEKELAPGNSLEDVKDIATRAISLTARIAGLFAVLDAAAQGRLDSLDPITADQWLRAQVLETYFLTQLIDMQRAEGGSGKNYLLQKTARWLQKAMNEHKSNEPLLIFERHLVNRIRGLTLDVVTEEIIPELEKRGWLRKGKDGRKGHPKYEVNPRIIGLTHET